ncbi:hypothetical protein PV04_00214 [Phialophora macrospora]|uniref:Uncharacterized protein n=1 Tax=Phialophora macrospora TaxID=1851006 RepID=A0A0D2FZU2_9EURO|nr:hypothetical protein PV04_00214 [Phialophora macrospora]
MDASGEAEADQAEAGQASNASTQTEHNGVATTFLNFKLSDKELLSAPKGGRVKAEIAFGDEGTIAYISEYGELVMMMKYLDVGATGMVTAASMTAEVNMAKELDEQLKTPGTGIGLRLYDWPSIENPQVQFVHDRWPRISITLPDVANIKIQLVVKDGCVFQQYIVDSISDGPQELLFRVNTDIGLWPTRFWKQWYDVYDNTATELEPDQMNLSARLRVVPKPDLTCDDQPPEVGELMLSFALFEDGKVVGLSYDGDFDPYDYVLRLEKYQKRELMAKYQLGATGLTVPEPEAAILNKSESVVSAEPELAGSNEPKPANSDELGQNIQQYVDICAFLTEEGRKYGTWKAWDGQEKSHFVFRRNLEHILTVCAIPLPGADKGPTPIAITDGEMLDLNVLLSSPYRFLLRMYEILNLDVEDKIADQTLKANLQRRIKHTCVGILTWKYGRAELNNDTGWYEHYQINGKPMHEHSPRALARAELVEVLHEFIVVFPEEEDLVLDMLKKKYITLWLKALSKQQHSASRLWATKEIEQTVDWYDYDHDDNNKIQLSHFTLVDLVKLWRSLRFLQKIYERRERDITTTQSAKNKSSAKIIVGTAAKSTLRKDGDGNRSESKDMIAARDPLEELNRKMNEDELDEHRKKTYEDELDEHRKKTDEDELDEHRKKTDEDELDEHRKKTNEDELDKHHRKKINNALRELDPAGIRSKITKAFMFSDSKGDLKASKIAVCRCARHSRPRTSFHKSDYPLLEAVDWGFFDDEPEGLLPAWSETLRSQDRSDKDWDNPLRYATAIFQAVQEQRVKKDDHAFVERQDGQSEPLSKREQSSTNLPHNSNSPRTVAKSNEEAKRRPLRGHNFRDTLLGSVFSSGLFAHEIDIFKKPVRTTWFAAAGRRYAAAHMLLESDFKDILPRRERLIMTRSDMAEDDKEKEDDKQREDNKRQSPVTQELDEEKRKELRKIRKAKDGKVPKVSQVGEKRIEEYHEPEWLYNELPCFSKSEEMDDTDLEPSKSKLKLPNFIRKKLGQLEALLDSEEFIIGDRWLQRQDKNFLPTRLKNKLNKSPSKALIIDVSRSTTWKTIPDPKDLQTEHEMSNAGELNEFLKQPRTRAKAKKRLIMLHSATIGSAWVLYKRCPPSERNLMAQFLHRHASFSNLTSKRTSRLANLWTTELHISFYESYAQPAGSMGASGRALFVEFQPEELKLQTSSRVSTFVKVTVGFQIVGDMYDRSWTCWILAATPELIRRASATEELEDDSGDEEPTGNHRYPWLKWIVESNDGFHPQRRVLEILLFVKIAKEAFTSTNAILEDIDKYLRDEVNRFPPGSTNSSFILASQRNLEIYSQVIRVLKALQLNAEAVNKAVKVWQEESSEALEKPRWSRSDEAKYGTKLSHVLQRSRRIREDLQEQEEKIKNKILEVERSNETTVSELSVNLTIVQSRTDENVRLFTYATVIFLPLGFSSSLFSMGGSPAHETVQTFSVTAIVVLVLTGLLLLNVKSLVWGFRKVGESFMRNTHSKMKRSPNSFWHEKANALKGQQLRNAGILQSQSSDSLPKEQILDWEKLPPTKLWYIWFWIWSCCAPLFVPFTLLRHALASPKAKIEGQNARKEEGNTAENNEGSGTNTEDRDRAPGYRFGGWKVGGKNSKSRVTTETRSNSSSAAQSGDREGNDIEAQRSRP